MYNNIYRLAAVSAIACGSAKSRSRSKNTKL